MRSPEATHRRLVPRLALYWRKLRNPSSPESAREIVARAFTTRLKLALHRRGVPIELQPPVYEQDDLQVISRVQPFTMTSPQRILALCDAVRYLDRNRIEGSIVECGVWRGGSMMAAALTLQEVGDASRDIYLYDTFEGMTEPGSYDIDKWGRTAAGYWSYHEGDIARAPLEDVQHNLGRTGYPDERCHYVIGKVEETIPGTVPPRIALLRLDTDWYESTKHEMEHLFPLLAPGGVLIIDDYGEWLGARRAIDEYFVAMEHAPLLHRIDYTGRICVIPDALGALRPSARTSHDASVSSPS